MEMFVCGHAVDILRDNTGCWARVGLYSFFGQVPYPLGGSATTMRARALCSVHCMFSPSPLPLYASMSSVVVRVAMVGATAVMAIFMCERGIVVGVAFGAHLCGWLRGLLLLFLLLLERVRFGP